MLSATIHCYKHKARFAHRYNESTESDSSFNCVDVTVVCADTMEAVKCFLTDDQLIEFADMLAIAAIETRKRLAEQLTEKVPIETAEERS